MKRTLFNLSKKTSQVKTYSIQLKPISLDLITKFLNNFSEETRNQMSNEFARKCYEASFQEIQKNIHKGTELIINKAKRDPLGSLEIFEKSVKIADTILENYSIESLNSENKLILAQAYAGYADILYKYKISEIETIKKMVRKTLELDPSNKIAKELNFDMYFYDIVPEPPSNKL